MTDIILSILAGCGILLLATVIHDVGRPRWRERRTPFDNSGTRRGCAVWRDKK